MIGEYKRDLNHNYLVLQSAEQIYLEDYQIRMLVANYIPGLLKCNIRMLDETACFYYEITSKQPLSRVFEKQPIKAGHLRTLLFSLKTALNGIEEYLLDSNNLVFEPEYIFMDIETMEAYFCCLPGYQKELNITFHEFTEYFLKRLDHSEEEGVLLGYELYRQSMEENYSMDQIMSLIRVGSEISNKEHEEKGEHKKIILHKEESEDAGNTQEQGILYRKKTIPLEDELKSDIIIEKRGKSGKTAKTDQKKKILEMGNLRNIVTGKDNIVGVKSNAGRNNDPKKMKLLVLAAIVIIIGAFISIGLVQSGKITLNQTNTTQIGGILFFALGTVGYLLSLKRDKKIKDAGSPIIKKDREGIKEEFYEAKAAGEEHIWEESSQPQQFGMTADLEEVAKLVPHMLISTQPDKYPAIMLEKDCIFVGKLESAVDAVIQNSLVSRIHAKIQKVNEEYYLCDLNSTNGTFLNGEQFMAHEKRPLCLNDEIRFADAIYHFR